MAAKDLSVKDRKLQALVVAGWRARVFLFNFILLTLKAFCPSVQILVCDTYEDIFSLQIPLFHVIVLFALPYVGSVVR
jgi:hypothetical protein